jgi:tetratricopeptide (TPR) repeat protein
MCGCGSHAKKKAAMIARWEESSAFAKLPLAEELAVNERYADAEEIVARCIKAVPLSPKAHYVMGKLHLIQSRNAAAQESLNLAIKYDVEMDEAYFMLGVISESEGFGEQALEYYSKAMELKPSSHDYVIASAELYAVGGDYGLAVDLLRAKSNQLYAGAEFKVALAEMLVRQGEVSEAITVYKKLLLIGGDQSEYLSSLGYCYIINENWSEGAKIFSRLSSNSDGSKLDTYTEMLGMCSMNSEDYALAMKCYDRLSVNRRGDVDVWLRMGEAALGSTRPKIALACAKRACALEPGNREAITLAGCAEYLQGDYAKALKTFGQIADESESSSFVRMMVTRCHRHLGSERKSVRTLEESEMLTRL